jgi:hypothetical protein
MFSVSQYDGKSHTSFWSAKKFPGNCFRETLRSDGRAELAAVEPALVDEEAAVAPRLPENESARNKGSTKVILLNCTLDSLPRHWALSCLAQIRGENPLPARPEILAFLHLCFQFSERYFAP